MLVEFSLVILIATVNAGRPGVDFGRIHYGHGHTSPFSISHRYGLHENGHNSYSGHLNGIHHSHLPLIHPFLHHSHSDNFHGLHGYRPHDSPFIDYGINPLLFYGDYAPHPYEYFALGPVPFDSFGPGVPLGPHYPIHNHRLSYPRVGISYGNPIGYDHHSAHQRTFGLSYGTRDKNGGSSYVRKHGHITHDHRHKKDHHYHHKKSHNHGYGHSKVHGHKNPSSYKKSKPSSYGQSKPSSYGQSKPSSYGKNKPSSYGQSKPSSYGHNKPSSYGQSKPSSYGQSKPSSYGQSNPSSYGHSKPTNHDSSPNYSQKSVHKPSTKYDYAYGVQDDYHGTDFSHTEYRDGHHTKGEYRVNLPDGRIQRVTYYTDENGYHPTVTYEGKAHHPEDHPNHYH